MLITNIGGYTTYVTDPLTQWATNQQIGFSGSNISGSITLLFSNKTSVTAEPVPVIYSDGRYIGDIPNKMLTEPYSIICYIRKSAVIFINFSI